MEKSVFEWVCVCNCASGSMCISLSYIMLPCSHIYWKRIRCCWMRNVWEPLGSATSLNDTLMWFLRNVPWFLTSTSVSSIHSITPSYCENIALKGKYNLRWEFVSFVEFFIRLYVRETNMNWTLFSYMNN